MKRILPFFLALVLLIVFIVVVDTQATNLIERKKGIVRDLRIPPRFDSTAIHDKIIDDKTLVIFGSSELQSLTHPEVQTFSILNSSEINLLTIGAGFYQMLYHTTALGAIGDKIKNKKAVLILSPQWFRAEYGNEIKTFPQTFPEEHFLNFMKNPKISSSMKHDVADFTMELLQKSPLQKARVAKYLKGYDKNGVDGDVHSYLMEKYWNLRNRLMLWGILHVVDYQLPSLKHFDYHQLMKQAEIQGKESTTSNSFSIDDYQWYTKFKKLYDKGEVKVKKQVYTESHEYYQLYMFLDLARELNIKVEMISIPVNAAWYHFQGKMADKYYEKIRAVAKDYPEVKFVDMTKYATEKYFFHDATHLGWKGWTRVNEEIYKFSKE